MNIRNCTKLYKAIKRVRRRTYTDFNKSSLLPILIIIIIEITPTIDIGFYNQSNGRSIGCVGGNCTAISNYYIIGDRSIPGIGNSILCSPSTNS